MSPTRTTSWKLVATDRWLRLLLQFGLQRFDQFLVGSFVFLRLLERLPPVLDGFIFLAELFLDVAEVIPDGGITAAWRAGRLFEEGQRLLVLAEFEQHPAHAVLIGRVVRFG